MDLIGSNSKKYEKQIFQINCIQHVGRKLFGKTNYLNEYRFHSVIISCLLFTFEIWK